LLDWETKTAAGKLGWLLEARPRSVPGIQLRIKHHFENGSWVPDDYLLENEHPFNNELRAQAWTAYLFTCADGSLTAAELLEKLKVEGALHPETPALEFAQLLATLVSGGFLQI
jgi:hypothetical protein